MDECALAFGLRRKREHNIGVSVKLTSSETAIANPDVKPNELMKRPTMPPMKPTGKNTASSESVVAITARPISLVPAMAASIGGIFFSSMNRYTFSSTIMASSITIPTIKVKASMVI